MEGVVRVSFVCLGNICRSPTAEAVTLREHLSFVELPDNNYQPRYDDPRAGYGGLTYVDYSAPIGALMQMR